ncbi:MAG: hypothetical protein ACRCZO_17340 [Cetobacterium sp.]|uniref:hypothetical protein n=1 Tax=Cetobacterium sp. TaxID=2071632 RepID=UPI003F39832F
MKGRQIIIFDDILTSGKTFYFLASKLEELKCKIKLGLFLARTVKYGDYNEEYFKISK